MSMFGNVLGAALGGANPLQSMITNMLAAPAPGAEPGAPAPSMLATLAEKFEAAGAGSVIQSWIGQGPNQAVSTELLQSVLGNAHVEALASKAGVDPQMLLGLLAQHLPAAVDHMTPDGALPA